MQIKAAVFDMDGTLIDSLMVWDVLWSHFGQRYLNDGSFRPTAEDDKKVRTLTLKDAMVMIHNHYAIGADGAELLDCANNLMADFYTNQVQLKPGVREFLDDCKAKGVKMCIASATATDLIDMAMEHCDLGKYFEKVFSCGTLGKGKDQPDIFLLAVEYLGEKIEDTWMFEDSAVAIETATKIGMPTVAIYDRYNYGQDRMRQIANHYIAPGETLMKLIDSKNEGVLQCK